MGARVRAPGSCGELVQGAIDGQYFLITCPVNIYSEAELSYGIGNFPCRHPKARTAMQLTARYLRQIVENCQITITSDLPVGKGMASSSADISAACQATAVFGGHLLSPDEIADIALSIEPTDAVFYPGIVMFDHIGGRIRRVLGQPPPLDIVILDLGGEVDTVTFNQRDDLLALNQSKEQEVRQAVEKVATGIAKGDCRLVAEGATISALANQRILYKPCLEPIISLSRSYGAIGVNAAHSGTVLGVLFPAGEGAQQECAAQIVSQFPQVQYIGIAGLIGGGLIVEEGDGILSR